MDATANRAAWNSIKRATAIPIGLALDDERSVAFFSYPNGYSGDKLSESRWNNTDLMGDEK
jgi:hypothetical protein